MESEKLKSKAMLKKDEEIEEQEATAEVQCTFRTSLPSQFAVPEDIQIQMSTGSVAKNLSDVLKQMISEEGTLEENEEAELKTRKLQFMVNDVFLTSTLQDLMAKINVTSESVLEVWYSFALDKPKPTMSMPQEEWISVIRSLSHLKNVKARSYIAAFFNGDLKIFGGKDSNDQELISAPQLHEDQISDAIYFKSDELGGKKIVVSCSEQPCPALKVCEVDTQAKTLVEKASASSKLAAGLNGWSDLALNPLSGDVFASSSKNYVRTENDTESQNLGSIQLWKLTNEMLSNGAVQAADSLKRQKVEAAELAPTQCIQVKGGVHSLTWLDGDNLIAGCGDHAIKIIDIEKSFVIKQSILTDNKVPTCIDTAQDNLILSGSEDGVVRLWDTRAGEASKSNKHLAAQFSSHSRFITQVCFNQQVENVFLSGAMDGGLKLWDIRNDEVPLANLKHKSKENKEDFKIFAVEWNGASQILSGGSDSHISVHTM